MNHTFTAKNLAKTDSRDIELDSIKGFLILCVVFGHLIESVRNPTFDLIYNFIYTFHMPAFMFIAGYNTSLNKQKEIRSILKMIYIFLAWNILYLFYNYILGYEWPEYVFPYWILWFIFCLILYKCLSLILKPKLYSKILYLALFIAISIGFIDSIGRFLSLQRLFYFLFFYILGLTIKDMKIDSLIYGLNKKKLLIMFFLCILLSLSVYTFSRGILHANKSFEMMGLDWSQGVSKRFRLITLSVLEIYLIFYFFYKYRIRIFSEFGKSSLLIFLAHGLLVLTFNKFVNFQFGSFYGLIFLLLVSLGICWIFSQRLISNLFKAIKLI